MMGIRPAVSRILRVPPSFLRVLPILYLYTFMYSEEDLSRATLAYRNNEYTSIRKLADAFLIPRSTLRHRLSGRVSYATAHE